MMRERRPLDRGPLIVVRPTVGASPATDYTPTGMTINEVGITEEQWYASPQGELSRAFAGGYLIAIIGGGPGFGTLHIWPTIATHPQVELEGRMYAIASPGGDQLAATGAWQILSGPLCGGSLDQILGFQFVLAGSPPTGYNYTAIRFEMRVNCPENLDAADLLATLANLYWIGSTRAETVAP